MPEQSAAIKPERPVDWIVRSERYERALRAILDVRLDTTPGVTLERAQGKARFDMRTIAEEALRETC